MSLVSDTLENGRPDASNRLVASTRQVASMNHRRGLRPSSLATGVAAGLVVALLGFSGSWNPLEHPVCTDRGQVAVEYFYLPAVLVNSPYGGQGWGNGTIPAGYPAGPGYPNLRAALGIASPNGTASAPFFGVNLSFDRLANATSWGIGPDAHCSEPFSVTPLHVEGAGIAGLTVPVPNNITQRGEATSMNFSGFPGPPDSPVWNNSFWSANTGNLTTCSSSRVDRNVSAPQLPIVIPFSYAGIHYKLQYTLPFVQSYHYIFPGNFGTWAVDNLSAPGGPGGGWAFNYLGPCV